MDMSELLLICLSLFRIDVSKLVADDDLCISLLHLDGLHNTRDMCNDIVVLSCCLCSIEEGVDQRKTTGNILRL